VQTNPSIPDPVEAGRVAAQLSDWQTITYFLMVLLVAFLVERYLYSRSVRQERKDMASERQQMWAVSEKFGEAATKLGEQTNSVVTELQVQRALNARLEGVVTQLEDHVSVLERRIANFSRGGK
jgi:hypothetical protein